MLEDIERSKYQRIWSMDEYRQYSPGKESALIAHKLFAPTSTKTLIDLGCGTGRAGDVFASIGYDVTLVDFVPSAVETRQLSFIESCLWSLPDDLYADLGYCCDVMEHIPESMIDKTLDNIQRVIGEQVFFQIALQPDSCGQLIGEKLHLTLRSADQWDEILSSRWTKQGMTTNGIWVQWHGRGGVSRFFPEISNAR